MKTNHPLRAVILSCLLFAISHLPIGAQPTNFTYQGQLTEGGVPAAGIYDFQFVIYNVPTITSPGASALSTDEAMDVPVTNGLFTAEIGFEPWFLNGEQRWLEVQVRTNDSGAFTGLTPWTEITPTPYAVRALTVSSNALAAYAGAVSLLNPSNTFVGTFSGHGSSVSNVNATTVGGLSASDFWKLDGNAGTIPGTHFIGTTDDRALEFRVNFQRVFRIELNGDGSADSGTAPDGAPNLIGGSLGNFVAAGVVGATIGGGGATNFAGSSGTNVILSDYSTIAGGVGNRVDAGSLAASIGGGFRNSIATNADHAVIAGGFYNDIAANSFYSAVVGGWDNNIAATSAAAAILGGNNNDIGVSSYFSAIGGGFSNQIASASPYSAIFGGAVNQISTNSSHSSIGGGYDNNIGVDSDICTIGGGFDNRIGVSSLFNTIAGGSNNRIGDTCDHNVISGGLTNHIADFAWHATVAGGLFNHIGSYSHASAIGGGQANWIADDASYAVIPGGFSNSIATAASYAFAAGRNAKANHVGCFVWADSTTADFASTDDDQFLIRASGGVGIGTDAPQVPLHVDGGTDTAIGGGGYVVSGDTAGANISIDNNEIMARDNGATSSLFLNVNGGTVAIGTSNADQTYTLRVNGSVAGVGAYNNISDERYKENITQVEHALDKVLRMRGVNFDWKKEEYPDLQFEDRQQLGFVAQELAKVLPEAVSQDEQGSLSVAYGKVIPVLVEAIKEQQSQTQAELNRRDAENAKLRRSNAALEKRLTALERIIRKQ